MAEDLWMSALLRALVDSATYFYDTRYKQIIEIATSMIILRSSDLIEWRRNSI
jgi:hypothetical protein